MTTLRVSRTEGNLNIQSATSVGVRYRNVNRLLCNGSFSEVRIFARGISSRGLPQLKDR